MNTEDIRDVKIPLEYPDVSIWIMGALVFFVLALLVGGWVWWHRRHPKEMAPVILPKPWEVAIKALNALMAKGYLEEGKFHVFYAELSDILRHYVEHRFSLRAPEMTTEEFLHSLKSSDTLTSEQKDVFKGFLEAADMVKFAKYKPSVDEAKEGYTLAQDFIQETTEGQGDGV